MKIDALTMTVLLALLAFGVTYNGLIAYLERYHMTEGLLSIFVVLGVAVTLVGVGLVNLDAAILALACFAASGLPMMIGSIARYIIKRNRDIERAKRDA